MRNKRMLYGRENVLVQCKCGSYLCLFTGLKTTDTDFISVSLLQVEMLTAYLFLCSYIGGNEQEGHFSLINEACSMLVKFSL